MARSPRRRRHWIVRLLRLLVLVYLGLGAAAYVGQDWLLYPGARARGEPPQTTWQGPAAEWVRFPSADGTPIAALFAPAARPNGIARPDAAGRPTILFFYGNGGTAVRTWSQIDDLRRTGANVLVPDYPGYGGSGGSMAEPGVYAMATAAWDFLQHRPSVDPGRVIVAGWSLGGGPAVDLAARRPAAGLMLFNAFTSMPEMAGRVLPWLPARYVCRPQYANESKMGRVHCPSLICNGLRDTLIPASMSDRLAAAAGGPVTRVRVPLAGHNDIFDPFDGDSVWPELRRFVEATAAGPVMTTRPSGR